MQSFDLLGLFSASFLAATFFPFQSELIFIAMLKAAQHSAWLLLLVAGAGNTLGSALNWWLGKELLRFRHKRWFPASEATLEKAQARFQRWGKWSLLLSWVPIIGDPLTIIAGVLRVSFPAFLAIVALAKTGRYLFLLLLFNA